MTVVYLTESNTTCYRVTFQNDGCMKVQKFKDTSDRENNILYIGSLKTFLGKIEVCDMKLMSGALDKSVFDGNVILFKLTEEYGKHSYVYIGGDMICSFPTNDNVFR